MVRGWVTWGRSERGSLGCVCGGGVGCGVTGERSVLNPSTQFQLAEGCDEAVVGSLVISQLEVAGPDHHHNVKPRLFGCFGLCKGGQHVSERGLVSEWVSEVFCIFSPSHWCTDLERHPSGRWSRRAGSRSSRRSAYSSCILLWPRWLCQSDHQTPAVPICRNCKSASKSRREMQRIYGRREGGDTHI